ncbi:ankyrin repeat domain-containing protein [Spirochaetota bacterium]
MGNNDVNRDIIKAVLEGNLKKVRKLAENGADVNTLIKEKDKTLLMKAAKRGNEKMVRLLVDLGADIDAKNKNEDETALFFACWEGHQEIAKFLIEKGADVHHKKIGGRTTLMYAVHSNSVEVVRILLEKGVDVNAANEKGLTALMYADELDTKIDSIGELLKHGADINQKNIIGKTVLMRAALYGSLKTVEFLLQNGADTSIISDEGWDVVTYAEDAEKNSKKMVKLLEKYGMEQKSKYYSYKIQMDCTECGQPLIINGPMLSLKCGACQSNVQIGKDVWKSIIESSSGLGGTMNILTYSDFQFDYRKADPQCSQCEARLNADKIVTGNDGTIVCEQCQAHHNTYPAPQWLQKYKAKGYHGDQIFCAEKQGDEVKEDLSKIKPIAIKCVSCGAVLKINTETPRNATCEHCATVQYLPDGLWLALHPVKKIKQWYIRFKE